MEKGQGNFFDYQLTWAKFDMMQEELSEIFQQLAAVNLFVQPLLYCDHLEELSLCSYCRPSQKMPSQILPNVEMLR